MADGIIIVPPDSTGKKIDTEELTVGANTVERERHQVAGAAATDIAVVSAANGLQVDVTRIAAGDTNIGNVDVVTLPALPAGTNNIGDVDVLTVPAPLSTTGGGLEATALRVTVASDSTGVLSVDDNGASLTVDVGTALPAGTNNIGDVDVLTLPALVAGTANIGDVDVLTVPAPLSTTGGGTEATAHRVTIANDSTGVLSVDDNGGSLTIDGNVGVSSLPASTNTIEVVGDVAHDSAAAGNPVLIGGYAENPDDTAPGNQVSAEADVVRFTLDRDGAAYTHPHPPRIWHVATEYTTTQTDTTVKAAPGAGLSLYITDIYLSCNAAVTVSVEESTTTLKFRHYADGQGSGVVYSPTVPIKIAANTLISVTTSAAVTVFLAVNGYTAP